MDGSVVASQGPGAPGVILPPSPSASAAPAPSTAPSVPVKGRFLDRLSLSPNVLRLLERVTGATRSSFGQTSTPSSPSTAPMRASSSPSTPTSAATRHAAQPTFARAEPTRAELSPVMASPAREVAVLHTQSVEARMAAFMARGQEESRRTELQDFCQEVAALEDPDLFAEIGAKVNQINRLYEQQKQLLGPDHVPSLAVDLEFEALEHQIAELRAAVGTRLTEYCTNRENQQVSAGVKIVANLLEGFKARRLLNAASDTHAMLNDLRNAMRTLTKMGERHVSDPALRRQVYGHIKMIQEHTHELVAIEKQRPKSFFERLRGTGAVERTASEVRALADRYYTDLNFSDDEVREFRDMSLEAYRPTRGHLTMFVDDICAGASHLATSKRRELKQDLITSYVEEVHKEAAEALSPQDKKKLFVCIDKRLHLQAEIERIKGIPNADSTERQSRIQRLEHTLAENEREIDRVINQRSGLFAVDKPKLMDLIASYERLILDKPPGSWDAMRADIATRSVKLKANLAEYDAKDTAIRTFETDVLSVRVKALFHPDLGNGNLREPLSMDAKTWKKQQELAKKAIDGLFDRLKASCADMMTASSVVPTVTSPEIAATVLTNARNDVLGDRMRWDRPIVRSFDIPVGPAAVARGHTTSSQVTHTMTCPNQGYPSSSFRGRAVGPDLPDCVQANLQRVEVACDGQNLGSYTSSATNVEFFQTNDALRAEATLQQTGEILLGKIDKKLQADPTAGRHRNNPVVVDVSTTLLLSPDTLRSWIYENPELRNWLKKKGHGIDESLLERRILEESLAAWLAFDRDAGPKGVSVGKEFVFHDKDGNERKLRVELNDRGEKVFALIDKNPDGTPKVTYVQFDISCYNAGCNKFTKNMTNAMGGRGLESLARTGIGVVQALGLDKAVIGAATRPYTGEPGQRLEDTMNARAFAKDTRRYNAKMVKMAAERQNQVDSLFDQAARLAGAHMPEVNEHYQRIDELKAELADAERKLAIAANPADKFRLEAAVRSLKHEIEETRGWAQSILGWTQSPLDDAGMRQVANSLPPDKKQKLLAIANELKMLHEIEGMVGTTESGTGMRQLRNTHLEAERAYYTAKNNNEPADVLARLDTARKTAFANWQTERQTLSMKFVNELKRTDLSPEARTHLESLQHQEDLVDMYNEVSDLLEFKEHRTGEGMRQNMYTLASSLVLLGIELDADPHTGCRSGKDRTSLQRMEIGTRLLLKNQYGRHLSYRELEQAPQTFRTREHMMLHSGHIDELARLNIGSSGLNLSGGYGQYLKNFGNGGQVYPSWYENVILYGAKNVFAMRLK